jgi:PIN domain nuclease of toxin-antitoxin system
LAPDNQLFMSAASWWELGIKQVLGRLSIDFAATRAAIEERGVVGIAVTLGHAERAATLNKLHGDPFDHMLVAQALADDMVLLTRDARLKSYGSCVLCV